MFEALFASMQGAYSANTIRAYQSDVAHYLNWYGKKGESSDPFQATLPERHIYDSLSRV